MTHRGLAFMATGLICVAVASAPAPLRAQEPVAPPPAAHGGSWWPTVIGAVAGAYLWPLAFPAVAEVAVATSAGTVETAIGTVAALPAAAAQTVGVEVPTVGAMDTLSAWRLSAWYPSLIGAVHGAYAGYFLSR